MILQLKIWAKKYYLFIVISIVSYLFLMPLKGMASGSGDPYEIWKTIQTYGTEDMYGTYVLYKGMLSIYPYVWLYRLSLLLSIDEWVFIKIFYAIAFSYITTIGLPNIVENLLDCKVKPYRRLLMSAVCFYFWVDTGALTNLMVDIPSFMYFLVLTNAALNVFKAPTLSIRQCLWIGLWLGVNLCSSGQYTMPAICIVIFIFLTEFKRHGYKIKQIFLNKWYYIRNTIYIIFSALIIKLCDNRFLEVVVGGLREKGAWIPSGDVWLRCGLSRFMQLYRTGAGGNLYANRNMAIYADYLGVDVFYERYEAILGGGWSLSILEYLKIFLKYPVDFILCYLDKFFIMLSPDKGGFHFLPLFIFYSCVFITLYLIVVKCPRWKDIFNIKFWIVFAFLWSIVPNLVMVVEMRCVLQIQGLILGAAICSDFIWNKIMDLFVDVRENKWRVNILEKKVSISLLIYIFFIVFCFMHIAGIYSTVTATEFEKIPNTLISFM